MYPHRLITLIFIPFLLGFVACSDIFDDTDAEVHSITIDDPVIPLGQTRRIVLNLRYSDHDVFSDNDDVAVALFLPAELEYLTNSAEIDGVFRDEDLDPIIVPCPDGSTILFFDVDDNDLDGAEDPSNSADARLELDIIASSVTAGANIEARADYNSTNASCGVPITAQASLIVSVVELV